VVVGVVGLESYHIGSSGGRLSLLQLPPSHHNSRFYFYSYHSMELLHDVVEVVAAVVGVAAAAVDVVIVVVLVVTVV